MIGKESILEDQARSTGPATADHPSPSHVDTLGPLMHERSARLDVNSLPQVVIGELVGITDDGGTPLLVYPGQPGTAALRARTVIDLHGEHIGKAVVLSFENGDASLPIVVGVLRSAGSRLLDAPGQVQVDADGERMIVSAKEQLVLRCGKASVTLTHAGKVIIEGSYVVSRSTGVNRVKGGSVQLN